MIVLRFWVWILINVTKSTLISKYEWPRWSFQWRRWGAKVIWIWGFPFFWLFANVFSMLYLKKIIDKRVAEEDVFLLRNVFSEKESRILKGSIYTLLDPMDLNSHLRLEQDQIVTKSFFLRMNYLSQLCKSAKA